MAGGHATHGGIAFQDEVAAFLAVHILAHEPVDQVLNDAGHSPKRFQVETTTSVDDIVVGTESGGYWFINAKSRIALSDSDDGDLASAIDQFVRQYLEQHRAPPTNRPRALNPSVDRFVIATKHEGSGSLAGALNPVIARIADYRSHIPRSRVALTASEERAYDIVIALINTAWVRRAARAPTPLEVGDFLRLLRLLRLEIPGVHRTAALAILRRVVLHDPTQAELAWDHLVARCLDYGRRRSGADARTLRDSLIGKAVLLQHLPSLQRDIDQLKAITDETLERLARFARLDVPTNHGPKPTTIKRRSTDAIASLATANSFLVIGDAGAGKSGAMYGAAQAVRGRGHPCVVLAVDRHLVGTLASLTTDLGLATPLLDTLEGWRSGQQGVLFIDALDASRGGESEAVFRDVISTVLTKMRHWNVVASVRKFDLRFGHAWRNLFPGRPVDLNFADDEFRSIRHLAVPLLDEEELAQPLAISEKLAVVLERASPSLRLLLRSPFNLHLLAAIVDAGTTADDLSEVSTQVQLLDHYWSIRIGGSGFVDREKALHAVAERMAAKRSLSLFTSELSATSSIEELLSKGILSVSKRRGDQIIQIGFAHHFFFDYTAARLLFQAGHSPDFASRFTASSDDALILTPAAALALRMLWDQDPERRQFWTGALRIAAATGDNAFARMLPARVGAEAVETAHDLQPLLAVLGRPSSPERPAAVFLLRHVFGSVYANLIPRVRIIGPQGTAWTPILRTVAELAAAEFSRPLNVALHEWVEHPDDLTASQRSDLNATGCLVLEAALASGAHDQGVISAAIKSIARTYSAEPQRSARTLRPLLASGRVKEYGHRELFWLSQEAKYLMLDAPDVLADVYRAAFCTPLPSADEKTQLGSSKILSLTSNKRQDFQGSRHVLQKRFDQFLASAPLLATQALCDSVDSLVTDEHSPRGAQRTFDFLGQVATFQEDHSCIWWNPADTHHDASEELLNQFVEGYAHLAEVASRTTLDAVVEQIARANRWACLWNALLRAGVRQPFYLADVLYPLMLSPVILESIDTRHAAGELLRSMHLFLPEAKRTSVERAILALPTEDVRNVLLGCLSKEMVVDETAKRSRIELEQSGIPANDPISNTADWRRGDDNWWYREAGIDLNVEPNASIFKAIEQVTALAGSQGEEERALSHYCSNWDRVTVLQNLLRANPSVPSRLLVSGLDALADAAVKALQDCKDAADLTMLPEVQQIIAAATNDAQEPERKVEPKAEGEFARSAGGWGRPAPRIVGAQALMLFIRASGEPTAEFRSKVLELAADPVPSVRYQIYAFLNVICKSDPELMWQIVERGFDVEANNTILRRFLSTLRSVLGMRPDWLTDRLLQLEKRLTNDDAENEERALNGVVNLLLHLALTFDQQAARSRIEYWLAHPVAYARQISTILPALRQAINLGDLQNSKPNEERVRKISCQIFEKAVREALAIFLAALAKDAAEADDRRRLEQTFRVLDTAATEIYFGSGAHDLSQNKTKDGSPTLPMQRRFLAEMQATLELLTEVPYPSVTHHLLETLEPYIEADPNLTFALVTKALLVGGKRGGYQLESLGVDLFVRIVRRFLADYRDVIGRDQQSRQALVGALEVFTEIGWPSARQLVYELPELLR